MKLVLRSNITVRNAMLYLIGIAVVVALKHHYSRATADDLAWILYPTSLVVECMSSLHFEKEAFVGYVEYSRGIVIAPACSGINFLIISFCTAFFSYLHNIPSLRRKWLWLAISLTSSYILTVFVNSLRIIVSLYFIENNVHYGWFSPERVHRLEGVVVFFIFLTVFYLLVGRVAASVSSAHEVGRERNMELSVHDVPSASVPLFWYCFITLLVPLLNGNHHNPDAHFAEHFLTVGLSCAALFFVLNLLRVYWKWITHHSEKLIRSMPKVTVDEGVQPKK